jgi:hypothetical protein
VAPLRIVPRFDIVKDRPPRIIARGPAMLENQLQLQGREETLGDRVVPAVPLPTHARDHAARGEHGAVVGAGVLGGFNRSSQHLPRRCGDGDEAAAIGSSGSGGAGLSRTPRHGAARRTAAVLEGHRARSHERGGGRRGWGGPGRRRPLVPGNRRDAAHPLGPVRAAALGALSLVRRARAARVAACP